MRRRDLERVHFERACVGANVRAARQRAGLTRGELAAMLHTEGVTTLYEQAIGRLERGGRDLTLPEALVVAEVLAAPLEVLTEGLER